jgi:hypothetical protein
MNGCIPRCTAVKSYGPCYVRSVEFGYRVNAWCNVVNSAWRTRLVCVVVSLTSVAHLHVMNDKCELTHVYVRMSLVMIDG